jgi:hypothetical protein
MSHAAKEGLLSSRVMVHLEVFCSGDFPPFWDGLIFLQDLSRVWKSLSKNLMLYLIKQLKSTKQLKLMMAREKI